MQVVANLLQAFAKIISSTIEVYINFDAFTRELTIIFENGKTCLDENIIESLKLFLKWNMNT